VKSRGWEKSLREHGKIKMKYRVTRPLQHVVTTSLEAKTSVCKRPLPCPSLVLLPLCTPLSPLLLQTPRCQAWIHHAQHCTRCEVASPQLGANLTALSRSVLFAEVAKHTYLETCQCLDALPGIPCAPVYLALVGSTVLA